MTERELFLAALDFENLDERARFLAEQCRPDQAKLLQPNPRIRRPIPDELAL